MKRLILLLTCMLICQSIQAAELRFAQVADAHFSTANNPQANVSVKVLNWAVRSLNIKNPKFVVFLGDNVDKSKEDNVIAFLKIANGLKMPYYLVTGNHDAHKNSGLAKEDFRKLVRKHSGDNSKKTYYKFSPNPYFLCVVLDGAVPFVPSNHGIYDDEQLKWLDKTLKGAKFKKVLIFQHFPIVDPAEDPSHTTLYKEKYQAILDKYDNVILISSGHFHVKNIDTDEKGVYHISSPALIKPRFEYDMVTVDYTPSVSGADINDIKVETVNLQ